MSSWLESRAGYPNTFGGLNLLGQITVACYRSFLILLGTQPRRPDVEAIDKDHGCIETRRI